MKTKVAFRVVNRGGEIIAAIGEATHGDVVCYSIACDDHFDAGHDWLRNDTKPYKGDAAPLIRQMQRRGYDNIEVLKRLSRMQ